VTGLLATLGGQLGSLVSPETIQRAFTLAEQYVDAHRRQANALERMADVWEYEAGMSVTAPVLPILSGPGSGTSDATGSTSRRRRPSTTRDPGDPRPNPSA
jgi:hypothetical protein